MVITVTTLTELATGWGGDRPLRMFATPRGDRDLWTVSAVTGSGMGRGRGVFVVKKVL